LVVEVVLDVPWLLAFSPEPDGVCLGVLLGRDPRRAWGARDGSSRLSSSERESNGLVVVSGAAAGCRIVVAVLLCLLLLLLPLLL
jgi:hypothetical protein